MRHSPYIFYVLSSLLLCSILAQLLDAKRIRREEGEKPEDEEPKEAVIDTPKEEECEENLKLTVRQKRVSPEEKRKERLHRTEGGKQKGRDEKVKEKDKKDAKCGVRKEVLRPRSLTVIDAYEQCKMECKRKRDEASAEEYIADLKEELARAEGELTARKSNELRRRVQQEAEERRSFIELNPTEDSFATDAATESNDSREL